MVLVVGASLLSFAVACGSAAKSSSVGEVQRDPSGRVIPPARAPMQLELVVVAARGTVEVRTSETAAWQPLAVGGSLAGVREVRAVRRGAILSLGHSDAAGRLWLRGGTTVRLGQDSRGVHLDVREGRARFRRTAASLPAAVDVASGSQAIDGDFVLFARPADEAKPAAGTYTDSVPTGARPELAAFSMLLEEPDAGAGVGRLEARAASSSAAAAEQLGLAKVNVKVTTAGDLAITEVEHVFRNNADENREGTFRFPVPDGALLTGMAMEIGGKLIEGEIVEREKAREIYDQIVDEMQDPALLEWEEGNWFKLRVFPIEGKSDKRVVIRYASPLAKGAAGWEYGFMLGVPDPQLPIGELTVTVNGVVAQREANVTQGIDLVVPVGNDAVPTVMQEVRADGIYTAVRVPAPSTLAAPGVTGPRRIAVVVDTSRSALEGKALELAVAKSVLGELTPADRFVVLASDVAVTPHASDYVAATPDAVAAALKFLDAIEPDGASNLAAALGAAGERKPTEVIYIGDGIPTWGDRDPAALGKLADAIGAPIHAGLVGKGASSELWTELAGRTGGRSMLVRRAFEGKQLALAAMHAGGVGRLANARVSLPGAAEMASVFPQGARTLYAGDELVTLIRTPADRPAPTELVLAGIANGKPMQQTISLAKPVKVAHVMQRWAAFQLAAMDAAGATREDIVALSKEAGLISRHTSLLVLENDEMFEQYQIERKQQAAADAAAAAAAQGKAPKITGGDLDSLGAARPSLSPDEIQPGDPEIKIPAPRDAQSVVVTFPFGDTKRAEWDAEANAWMVRFLIDKATVDGEYQVSVTVTHRDGRIELLSLPYSVDTQAPLVELTATPTAGGYKIRAKQLASADGSRKKDADRVELALPDGTILVLKMTAWGRFEGVWQTAPLSTPVTLRAVISDRALNQSTKELVIQ